MRVGRTVEVVAPLGELTLCRPSACRLDEHLKSGFLSSARCVILQSFGLVVESIDDIYHSPSTKRRAGLGNEHVMWGTEAC